MQKKKHSHRSYVPGRTIQMPGLPCHPVSNLCLIRGAPVLSLRPAPRTRGKLTGQSNECQPSLLTAAAALPNRTIPASSPLDMMVTPAAPVPAARSAALTLPSLNNHILLITHSLTAAYNSCILNVTRK